MSTSASETPTKVFEGHTGWVMSVAYFSNGERIISGSHDKTVRIWNVENQKQDGDCLIHDFAVHSLAMSPDERTLVSGGKGIVVWDLESRTVVWKKGKREARGYYMAYSPTGRFIAASHKTEIVLLDAETGQQIREPLECGESLWCLAFSPDGTRVAAGSADGNVRVFDVATGATIVGPFTANEVIVANGSRSLVTSLTFTLDGQQIVTASLDGFIRVWDAASAHEVGNPMPVAHKDYLVDRIALNPDGRRIACASQGGMVCIWDLSSRRQISNFLQTQRDFERGYLSVAWSPDGCSIIVGGVPPVIHKAPDTRISNIYLWEVAPLHGAVTCWFSTYPFSGADADADSFSVRPVGRKRGTGRMRDREKRIEMFCVFLFVHN